MILKELKGVQNNREFLIVLALSTLGLMLRLYQLGTDSLWFDEIGVAIAIRSPTIPSLLEIVRSHVMAMPLDYMIGWLFTRSCQTEACLRLPAALWGTLTIPVSYILFRQLVDYRVAILGALVLTFTPLHIHYSQELRFYSPLVFFYILSTLTLLRACEHPTFRRWLSFTLIIITGSYFHLYVYLAFINGIFWIIFSENKSLQSKKILIRLITSFMVASLVILPGYLYFKGASNYGLFAFTEAVINIMIGFGWLPTILFPLQIGFVWYPFFVFFQLVGLSTFLFSKNRRILSWIAASMIQVGIILFANIINQYAVRGRQLIILMPLLCLLVAQGIIKLYTVRPKFLEKNNKPTKMYSYIRFTSFIGIGIVISVLSMQSYYHMEKSLRREISVYIIQKWKQGDEIWVTPAWEKKFYGYYFSLLGYPEMEKALVGSENFHLPNNTSMPRCWVTNEQVSAVERDIILEAGFKEIPLREYLIPDSQVLLCR